MLNRTKTAALLGGNRCRLKRARDQEDLLYSTPASEIALQGVARAEPQSRARHVPGITNYAPRTVIIS